MTLDELKQIMNADDPFLKMGDLDPKYRVASHKDLCAFILLDRLVPAEPIDHMPGHAHDLISCAKHDEFFLRTDLEKLAQAATKEDLIALMQCGIRLDDVNDCLAMFT